MNPSCLAHVLNDDERARFDAEGYLVVEGALSDAEVTALNAVLDRLRDANELASPERYAGIDQRVLHLGFITLDRAFMDLIDHPRLFPKVWGILGPNIYLYSTHLIITPPQADEFDPDAGHPQLAPGFELDGPGHARNRRARAPFGEGGLSPHRSLAARQRQPVGAAGRAHAVLHRRPAGR